MINKWYCRNTIPSILIQLNCWILSYWVRDTQLHLNQAYQVLHTDHKNLTTHWFSFVLAVFALSFRTDLLCFCFVCFFLSASVGHSAFRLLAYELEWNVEGAVQFWPGKTPGGLVTFPVFQTLESDSTRLAVVFCPAWAVSVFLRSTQSDINKVIRHNCIAHPFCA